MCGHKEHCLKVTFNKIWKVFFGKHKIKRIFLNINKFLINLQKNLKSTQQQKDKELLNCVKSLLSLVLLYEWKIKGNKQVDDNELSWVQSMIPRLFWRRSLRSSRMSPLELNSQGFFFHYPLITTDHDAASSRLPKITLKLSSLNSMSDFYHWKMFKRLLKSKKRVLWLYFCARR